MEKLVETELDLRMYKEEKLVEYKIDFTDCFALA